MSNLIPPLPIKEFLLERYFARYEFQAPYLLSSSDCETLSIADLLARAGRTLADLGALGLGYTESPGSPTLRAAVARLYQEPGIGPPPSAENVLIVVPEEGIFLTMWGLLSPGDEVIVQTPCYQSLAELATYHQTTVLPWPIQETDAGWTVDLDQLAALITAKTRLIVFNTPHNPTGYHLSRSQFNNIIKLARQHTLWLFCDEMYRGAEYQPEDEVSDKARALQISGSELRRRLGKGLDLPDWFSYPEVVDELRKAQPPLFERGFTVFFTGLSGAGKSTLARGLLVKLLEDGRRPVTLLDGDIVRTNLSSELGFSREHRSLNVRRIGFVASEITKNRGIAICAPIAPYEADRLFNRELISHYGGYLEVYVNTPLEVCEQRDVKGLYAKARQGLIKQVTGIDDPYEAPADPEIVVDSSSEDPEALAQIILLRIEQLGYL